ncbi:MAG: DUF3108 domain-containing protein [Rhodospirillales bacterium]
MRFGKRATILATVLAGGLGLAPAAGSAAEPREAKLTYDVHIGGIRAVTLDLSIGLAPEAYQVKVRFGTDGWIGRLVDWQMDANSSGRIEDGAIRPVAAASTSRWNRKERLIGLRYSPEGVVDIVRAEPPLGEGRDGIPDAWRRNTLDLASAVLTLVRGVERGGRCGGTLPVFDGRRRYDLVAEDLGEDTIRRTRYGIYSGKAVACRLAWQRYEKPGGDADAWQPPSESTARDTELAAWLAPVAKGLPPVPVLLQMEMRIGEARAHLVRGEVIDGAGRRQLLVAENPAN